MSKFIYYIYNILHIQHITQYIIHTINDYYNEDLKDSVEPKPSSKLRQPLPTKQMSNSVNDFLHNLDRKRLLKRYGESDGHPSSDWSISQHPTTEEELRDMMKYDPYYAQYYYSKYRPQEEGRYAKDDSENYISKKIRNVRDNESIFR